MINVIIIRDDNMINQYDKDDTRRKEEEKKITSP